MQWKKQQRLKAETYFSSHVFDYQIYVLYKFILYFGLTCMSMPAVIRKFSYLNAMWSDKIVYVTVDTLPCEGRADTIIVVAAGWPETNDWEEVGETRVPWGVVMTRPASTQSGRNQSKWKEIITRERSIYKKWLQWTHSAVKLFFFAADQKPYLLISVAFRRIQVVAILKCITGTR